jgi:ABC-2 type transport system permease protein
MATIGIQWSPGQVVWDGYNPHPDLASLPLEIVFVGRGGGNAQAFNEDFAASSGLQEVVLIYPGAVRKAAGSSNLFEPILNSGQVSGTLDYRQLVQRNFFGGVQLAGRNLPHNATGVEYTFAARIRGTAADSDTTPTVNVMVIADLDFVSDQFFQIRRMGIENLNFDNITFFLNCIDVLVGDESFISLRKRRVKHRTLEAVEARTRAYAEARNREQQEAEADAQRALNDAQRRLNQKVAEVQQRTDLDAQTKQIMARNLQEVENRRLEALTASINAERDAKIQRSKEDMETQIRGIQSGIKTLAGLLPPIPVFIMGTMVFLRRQRREREGAAAVRRLRS